MKYVITLTGRIPSKKNSRRRITVKGRSLSIPSKNHKIWHEDVMWQIMSQKRPRKSNRCEIELLFHMPDNRVADLTNKAESVMDALVDAEVIEDDKWQVVRPLVLDCAGIDKENPRVIITIIEV